MDLHTLRSAIGAVALGLAGIAQAALPTYSATSVDFVQDINGAGTDLAFYLNSPPHLFDNNHFIARRNWSNGSLDGTSYELYDLADLSAPVARIDGPLIPAGGGSGWVIGPWMYVDRYDASYIHTSTVRCNYTAAPSPARCDDIANWELVPGTDQGSAPWFAQASSSTNMTGVEAYTWRDTSNVSHHSILLADGSSFDFASDASNMSRAQVMTRLPADGYTQGLLTVLVAEGTGARAYVFTQLDAAHVFSFALSSMGSPVVEPLDGNAAGRAAFLKRNSLSDQTGTLAICDMTVAVDTAGGTPIGVNCPAQDLGTISTVDRSWSRMMDNNVLLVLQYPTDTYLWDTDNVGAAPVPVADQTLGAMTGPLGALGFEDGRILAVPMSDAVTTSLYHYTLLDPSTVVPPSANKVTVVANPAVINPGDSRNVTVSLNAQFENLYGVEFHCQADPSILEFVSGDFPPMPGLLTVPFSYDGTTGIVGAALSETAPMDPVTGSATISVLNYVANAPYGTTAVTCDVLGSDINGNPITFTVQNATVTINDGIHVTNGATISGTVVLPYGSDMSGIVVTLTINGVSVSTVTDQYGHYSFSDVMDGNIQISFDAPTYVAQCLATTVNGGSASALPNTTMAAGDLNDDNTIDIADFTLMAGHFDSQAGQSRYLAVADLNKDGKVNVQDLAILGSHFGMTNCTTVP